MEKLRPIIAMRSAYVGYDFSQSFFFLLLQEWRKNDDTQKNQQQWSRLKFHLTAIKISFHEMNFHFMPCSLQDSHCQYSALISTTHLHLSVHVMVLFAFQFDATSHLQPPTVSNSNNSWPFMMVMAIPSPTASIFGAYIPTYWTTLRMGRIKQHNTVTYISFDSDSDRWILFAHKKFISFFCMMGLHLLMISQC